jgi:AcrR family transcriptional regulator
MSSKQGSLHEVETSGLWRPAAADGLGHERVADIQRARMLRAMIDAVAEHGVANVTVADVVARSGVSRRTFYEIFEDRESCFLAAFEETVRRIATIVIPAYERPGSWRAKIRAGLTTLLACLEDDHAAARLLIVETLGAGPKALQRRNGVLSQIIGIVDEGRGESTTNTDPPPLVAEGIVGGALSILHARLTARSAGRLSELAGPLLWMIVLPYLGTTAARTETDRPIPKQNTQSPIARGDPLKDLQMRLTYRTIRVLTSVATHPGSSNRIVADGAGITDQGQISKLLTRLHRLGLIQNTGTGSTRGEPNAWVLTAIGWDVHAAITQQATHPDIRISHA